MSEQTNELTKLSEIARDMQEIKKLLQVGTLPLGYCLDGALSPIATPSGEP